MHCSDTGLILAAQVSQDRLWSRVMAMAQHGATPRGGVNRQAFSAEDAAGQAQLMQWAAAHGFRAFRDEIGNLFIRREGREAGAPPVLIGSHLDSQPTGGKFDGAYGVLAAFEVLEMLATAGAETAAPIEVVAWANEEGSRYTPGAMGSAVFAGVAALDAMLACTDAQGKTVRDELATVARLAPAALRSSQGLKLRAYLEAHIEQGPRLEAAGLPIGIVTSVQGMCRFLVTITGREAHAGTTPRLLRKDALSTAVELISRLEQRTCDETDTIRFTVGSFSVAPNSPNTVPGTVRFTIDLRHPEEAVLHEVQAIIKSEAQAVAVSRGCKIEAHRSSHVSPTHFSGDVIALLQDSAAKLDLPYMAMPSGAGHDAMHIAATCPTGMIFVPCLDGVSHNESESATPQDLAAGTRLLAAAAISLANPDPRSRHHSLRDL